MRVPAQRDVKAKYLTRLAKSRLAPKLTEIDVDIKTYNELCHKLNTSTFKSKFVHDVFRTKAGKLVMTSKSRLDVHVNNQVVTFRKKETIFIGNSNVYEFESKNLATTLIVMSKPSNLRSLRHRAPSSRCPAAAATKACVAALASDVHLIPEKPAA